MAKMALGLIETMCLVAAIGAADAALLALLRLPLLYPEDHHLAADALGEAARLLEASGQASAAQRLRRELIRDYPDTLAGRHAEQQMQ